MGATGGQARGQRHGDGPKNDRRQWHRRRLSGSSRGHRRQQRHAGLQPAVRAKTACIVGDALGHEEARLMDCIHLLAKLGGVRCRHRGRMNQRHDISSRPKSMFASYGASCWPGSGSSRCKAKVSADASTSAAAMPATVAVHPIRTKRTPSRALPRRPPKK